MRCKNPIRYSSHFFADSAVWWENSRPNVYQQPCTSRWVWCINRIWTRESQGSPFFSLFVLLFFVCVFIRLFVEKEQIIEFWESHEPFALPHSIRHFTHLRCDIYELSKCKNLLLPPCTIEWRSNSHNKWHTLVLSSPAQNDVRTTHKVNEWIAETSVYYCWVNNVCLCVQTHVCPVRLPNCGRIIDVFGSFLW